MSDKSFRDFIARMNQIGQVARICNPFDEVMHCEIEIPGEAGAIQITLPPGCELRFMIPSYDTRATWERKRGRKTLDHEGRRNA